MSTPGHDAPAANVGEHARSRRARWFEYFAGKLRIAGGNGDRTAGGQDGRAVQAGIIGPERRADRPGEPVKRDVGEHAVPADCALDRATAIGTGAELRPDPRSEPGGRIRQGECEWLRPRALDPLITGLLARPMRKLVEVTPLLLGRIGKGGRIAARGHHQIDVDSDQAIRIRIAEPAGDRGSPIATLRAEADITQHVMHEGGDTIRHFGNTEPPLAWVEG